MPNWLHVLQNQHILDSIKALDSMFQNFNNHNIFIGIHKALYLIVYKNNVSYQKRIFISIHLISRQRTRGGLCHSKTIIHKCSSYILLTHR